jgi:hypothetical protein
VKKVRKGAAAEGTALETGRLHSHCPSLFTPACRITHTVSSDISIRNTLSAKHAEGVLATKRCHSTRGANLLDERATKVNNERGGAA